MKNKAPLKSVYLPAIFERSPSHLDSFFDFSHQHIYFSLGREVLRALVSEISKVKNQTIKILLPEFICRDVLDSIKDLDIAITWYEIDLFDLSKVNIDQNILNSHHLLFIVNYFGKAAYFDKQNCPGNLLIIEDNAHGFLGIDRFHLKLGNRFDFGLFSLRKTLPVAMGAALYYSETHSSMFKDCQKKQLSKPLVETGLTKEKVRLLLRILPLGLFKKLINLRRILKKSGGTDSLNEPLSNIYFPKNFLMFLNPKKERERRLKLHLYCANLLEKMTPYVEVISFAEGEVPYGFVFILKDLTKLKSVRSLIENEGGDLVNWPDLPEDVLIKYPNDCLYKQVYFIPFNW